MDEILARALIESYLGPLTPLPTQLHRAGRLRRPVRCLLCDIYGTLLISASGGISRARHAAAGVTERLSALIERYRLPFSAGQLVDSLQAAIVNEHARARAAGIRFPEVRIENIWERLLPLESPEQVEAFAFEYELVVNPVWAMPHLADLLSVCRDRGVALGIVSNAQFFTPLLLAWFGGDTLSRLGFCDDLTIFSYRLGIAKPSRQIYQMAVERLSQRGISPQEAVVMGNDMENDILPAARCGFQTVLFGGDARSLRTADSGAADGPLPDLIVTDLQQMISCLHDV